jgi:hypothetical protein
MLGMCADPSTGAPLGRPPNNATHDPTAQKKGLALSTAADPDNPPARSETAEASTRKSAPRLVRAPVAGFDLTFSPSKSVSVAWAAADADTKAVMYDCHRQAVDFVVAYAEREVFHPAPGPTVSSRKTSTGSWRRASRTGTRGPVTPSCTIMWWSSTGPALLRMGCGGRSTRGVCSSRPSPCLSSTMGSCPICSPRSSGGAGTAGRGATRQSRGGR